MGDSRTPYLLAPVFKHLAKKPDENKAFAKKLWKESANFDFHPSEMECDAALKKLGLAKRGLSEDWPEDGPTWLYQGLDY